MKIIIKCHLKTKIWNLTFNDKICKSSSEKCKKIKSFSQILPCVHKLAQSYSRAFQPYCLPNTLAMTTFFFFKLFKVLDF